MKYKCTYVGNLIFEQLKIQIFQEHKCKYIILQRNRSMSFTLLQLYASSAVHSDWEVGLDNARMIGFCIFFFSQVSFQPKKWSGWKNGLKNVYNSTSLKEAMASITSFVKVFPTPEVPINTVGLMDYVKHQYMKNFIKSYLLLTLQQLRKKVITGQVPL